MVATILRKLQGLSGSKPLKFVPCTVHSTLGTTHYKCDNISSRIHKQKRFPMLWPSFWSGACDESDILYGAAHRHGHCQFRHAWFARWHPPTEPPSTMQTPHKVRKQAASSDHSPRIGVHSWSHFMQIFHVISPLGAHSGKTLLVHANRQNHIKAVPPT